MIRHGHPHEEKAAILIAEDSPTQAAQLSHLLESHGYSVLVAASGREALSLLDRHGAAMLISDIMMPEMDGYELARTIRADPHWNTLPILLVTTLSDPLDVIRGLECGADNFIRKPYEERFLLSRIRYLLASLELRENRRMTTGVEIQLAGHKYFVTSDRQQILDLLISTYEQAVAVNDELKTRERELMQANQVLSALFTIAGRLNEARSVERVAHAVLEGALELPGVEAGWISLLHGGSEFRLIDATNLPPELAVDGGMEGDCTCRRELLAGELDATKVIECERLRKAPGDQHGIACHATVPLVVQDRPVGVMNLVGRDPGAFSSEELEILSSLGNQVSVALERAQLHENLESIVEERTNELTAEIVRRRQAEEDLRASEQRYRLFFENTPHPMWIYEAETLQFLMVNPAATALYQYSEEEFRSMTIKDLRPEDDLPALFEAIAGHREQAVRVSRPVRHRKRDGSLIFVEVAATNIPDYMHRPVRLVQVINITEEMELQNSRREMELSLEQVRRVESLGRVAATIAHEFNNVLMGIQPFAEVIRKNAADSKSARAAEQIIQSVGRGKSATADILRFTRASEPVLCSIDLSIWVQKLAPELRALIGERIELVVGVPSKPVFAMCDPAQMQQVVTNLVVNARDAITGNGSIRLRLDAAGDSTAPGAEPPKGKVLLEVNDTGAGIPPGLADKIFDPLFTTKQHGTGLGLAVVQQVVARHGGSISLASTPGQGTTLSILLPAASRPDEQVEVPHSSHAIARVLLIEDEPAVGEGISALLESEGIKVRWVDCGKDALHEIFTFDPECVVLDLSLPDMSGMEVFREIRRVAPKVPVLFSSGHGDDSVNEVLGPNTAFLSKPYDFEVLIKALRDITASSLLKSDLNR